MLLPARDEVRHGFGNAFTTAVILGSISLVIFLVVLMALSMSADIMLIIVLPIASIGGVLGGKRYLLLTHHTDTHSLIAFVNAGKLIVVHNPGIMPVTDKPLIEAWKEAQEHPEGRVADAGIWDLLCCRCTRLTHHSKQEKQQAKDEKKQKRLKKTANFVKNLPGKLWKKKPQQGEEAGVKMPTVPK